MTESDGILEYGLGIAGIVAAVSLAVWAFQRLIAAEEKHIQKTLQEARKETHDKDEG